MRFVTWLLFGSICPVLTMPVAAAVQRRASELRLVPFPKQVEMSHGGFKIGSRVKITVTDSKAARQAALDLSQDLAVVARAKADVVVIPARTGQTKWFLCLSTEKVSETALSGTVGPPPAQDESYAVAVTKGFAAVRAQEEAGLVWGIQTLRQLVQANISNGQIPCLVIRDWPSLRYRGFQDDLTRCISSKLSTLQHEVRTGSLLKYNFWTYYMEDQFQFHKHPDIGPKGGQLTPEELKSLVSYATSYNVEIVGCQQSFGHFDKILRLPAYAHLRQSEGVINPTDEESYKFLDDLYSEVAPIATCKLFNVCCDEVGDLAYGPTKDLAEKIGQGGVYTMHIKRIHDILKDKYGKRMMMWGDIIMQHPENLKDIPKDTIMLSWGYDASPSFENAVKPFAESGYDFFVCPGVSCWFRILPVFDNAVGNIQNYVRDGAKYGALGMLLTSWDDDTSNFFSYNWHGVGWGAECSWNASKTTIEDFNRRIGAVLFGEKGDHFGQAIALLGKAEAVPGLESVSTPRFWRRDTAEFQVSREVERKCNKQLLDLVEPALKHLEAAKKEARFNKDLLDYFIFGAERLRLLATRSNALLDAAEAYEQAGYAVAEKKDAGPLLGQAAASLKQVREEHLRLRERCHALWVAEDRPYAMDWNLNAYTELAAYYDSLINRLGQAAATLKERKTLVPAKEVGLQIIEKAVRRTRPQTAVGDPLEPGAEWALVGFSKRLGLVLEGGGDARRDQPAELDLPLRSDMDNRAQLMELDQAGGQKPVLCQLQSVGERKRLVFLAPGDLPADGKRSFLLYFDPSGPGAELTSPSQASCRDAKGGMKWIENDQVRLLVAPEGAHIYRWEIKALNNLDVTQPGETQWFGFADVLDASRCAPNRIEVLADGPAVVRLKCTNDAGLEKTISLWAGVPWVEVTFNAPVSRFWCYDDAKLMGPGSATPGTYLFSNGDTGTIKGGQGRSGQWGAKYLPGGPLDAVLTPGEAPFHIVGPGGGDGGVGVEGGSAAHFVIYGGTCPESPKDCLERLCAALDYRAQPGIELYAVQERK